MDWRDLIAWQRYDADVVPGPTGGSGLFALDDPAVAVANGGSGYAVGDRVQAVAPLANATAVWLVATLGVGSAVATVTSVDGGAYQSAPANPIATVSVSPGVGTGLTLTLTPSAIPGGLVRLCPQDPHRIYLAISAAQLFADATLYAQAWLAPRPMNAPKQGNVLGSQFNTGYILSEFWLDKHGLLCQLAWYAWCALDGVAISVVQVVQDESPCDRMPKWRQRGQVPSGLRFRSSGPEIGVGGDKLNADSQRRAAPRGAGVVGGVAKPLLGQLWAASGLGAGGNGVSGGPAAPPVVPPPGGQSLSGYLGSSGDGGGSGGGPGTAGVSAPAVTPAGVSGPGQQWWFTAYPPGSPPIEMGPYASAWAAQQAVLAGGVPTAQIYTTGSPVAPVAPAAPPPPVAPPALPESGPSALTLGAAPPPLTAPVAPAPTLQWWFYAGLPLGASYNLKGPYASQAEAQAARGVAMTTMQGVTDVFSS